MLEVGYLIYCGRYFYPVLVLLLFTISAVLLVHTLRRQRKKIIALVNECRLTPLVWDGWVRAISSHKLLPGDVMVLQPGKALCDMVVLQGTCLVMESMLSGEVRACGDTFMCWAAKKLTMLSAVFASGTFSAVNSSRNANAVTNVAILAADCFTLRAVAELHVAIRMSMHFLHGLHQAVQHSFPCCAYAQSCLSCRLLKCASPTMCVGRAWTTTQTHTALAPCMLGQWSSR
jgi:P-type E1-E2 ATPase